MKAKQIQQALFEKFGNSSLLMVPNYSPFHWFECDMMRVTKGCFMEEFEIKLSVADFKADALKGPSQHEINIRQHLPEGHYLKKDFNPLSKHERLAQGDAFGPRRFWFCMPEEISSKVEIPVWAGLISFRPFGKRVRFSLHGPGFKRAPNLHRHCIPIKVTDHARSVFYWRYWSLRNNLKEEATP